MRRIAVILIIAFSLFVHSDKIQAGIIGSVIEGIATEPTQIMNNIELTGVDLSDYTQVIQQVRQLAHEVEMINNQLKNLETLNNNPTATITTLEQLAQAVQRGQILSYASSNIDSQYAHLYPGYAAYRNQNLTPAIIQQRYTAWDQGNANNIKDTLHAAGLQEQTIFSERQRLQTITAMSRTAHGRLQALQAGNLIAAEQTTSLQRLRELVMTNMQLQANYQAQQQDRRDVERAQWQQEIGTETTNTTDGMDMGNLKFHGH